MQRKRRPVSPDLFLALLGALGLVACALLFFASRPLPPAELPRAATMPPSELEPLFSGLEGWRRQLDRAPGAANDGNLTFADRLALLQRRHGESLDNDVLHELEAGAETLAGLLEHHRQAVEKADVAASQRQFLAARLREEGWKIQQWSRQLAEPASLSRDAARLGVYLGRYLKTGDADQMRALVAEEIRPLVDGMTARLEGEGDGVASRLRAELGKLRRQIVASDGFPGLLAESRRADETVARLRQQAMSTLHEMTSLLLRLPAAPRQQPAAEASSGIGMPLALALGAAILLLTGLLLRAGRLRQPSRLAVADSPGAPVAPLPVSPSFFDEAKPSVRALHEVYRGLVETIARLSDRREQVNALVQRGEREVAAADEATSPSRPDCRQSMRDHSQRIDQAMQSQLGQVEAVNASCQKVDNAISEVEEIAFEINLLALNAAVEAAHAGESGNGFAIVAAEVRELAQRSTESASEIRGLITDAMAQVEAVRDLVLNAIGEVEALARLAQGAGVAASQPASPARDLEPLFEVVTGIDAELETMHSLAGDIDLHSRHLRDLIRAHSATQPARAVA